MPLVGHAGCPRVRFVDASAPSLEKTKKFSNQDSNSEPSPSEQTTLPSRPLEQICKMKICLGFCAQKCFWKIGGVPKWPKTSFDGSRPLLTRFWGVSNHFRGWAPKVAAELHVSVIGAVESAGRASAAGGLIMTTTAATRSPWLPTPHHHITFDANTSSSHHSRRLNLEVDSHHFKAK